MAGDEGSMRPRSIGNVQREEGTTVEGRCSTMDDTAKEKPAPEGGCSEDAAGCSSAGDEAGEEISMSDACTEHEDAEEEADAAAATDDDGATDSDARMSGTEYVLAYKELPQYEIDLIMQGSTERDAFTDTELFKTMTADPSVMPDDDKAVSGLGGTMAAVAVAMASASAAAAAAAEAAKHAAVAAAAAKQAKEAAAEAAKQAEAEAAKQTEEAEEEASDDEDVEAAEEASDDEDVEAEEEASDDEDESDAAYNAWMSGTEYILAYKELPQYEIDLILKGTDVRVPFTDTERFKSLAAHPSVTQADIDAAAAEHEDRMDARAKFREYVRQEYEAKGYVGVSDEYIAKRVRTEEFCKKRWEELFVDSDDDDDDGSDEEQEVKEKSAM